MPEDVDGCELTRRAQTAHVLIEATELPFADIALAADFTGVAELNQAVRQVCGAAPAQLRDRLSAGSPRRAGDPITLSLRLPTRLPFAYRGAFGHLAACVAPGCEEIRDGAYRRALRLPHGSGVVGLTPHSDHVRCILTLDDRRDLADALGRCRRLLDLDADPLPVIEGLTTDPDLAAAVRDAPGQRIPGTVDAAELAVRVVLSQQVSLKAAATHAGRLVAGYGDPIVDPAGGLTHTFPSMQRLTDIDPAQLALPRSRRASFTALVTALAEGTVALAPDCDWQRARAQLRAIPGIGPWTAEVIAMRGLGDPDAFPATDLGLRAAAANLGLPAGARRLTEHAEAWRPWRSYATQHLWGTLDHAVNTWPPKEIA